MAPFSKSIVNVESGLKERVYYLDSKGAQKPTCVRSHLELSQFILPIVNVTGTCNRVTGSEFIASRTGSKRHVYVRARQELFDSRRSLGELAQLAFFTKYENTLVLKPQVPRIISPRDPRFNYLLGRYTVAAEHKIFDALTALVGGSKVIAKGLTQQEKAGLIVEKLRPGYCCVGLDASRFDQTIGSELLKAEHAIYKALFPGDRLLASLLRCQLHNRGQARCFDGVARANIGPMRCSGDQNTSLGNCIISVLLVVLYCREHGIVDFDVLCDGDDLLLFVPATSLPLLADLSVWYLRWGLRMKIEEPAYVPEQVEFCQSRPIWMPYGWLLVRNPVKVFATDYAGGAKLGNIHKFEEQLRAVGLCGLSMAAGVPLLQAYYQWGVAHGKTGKFNFTDLAGVGYQYRIQVANGSHPKAAPVDPRTRESFARAFGVLEGDQLDVEEAITNMAFSRRLDGEFPQPLIFDI